MIRSLAQCVNVRQYRASDWHAVRHLFVVTNRELARPELAEAFENYVTVALETEIDRIAEYYGAGGSFWVAEDRNGVLLGMYGLEQVRPMTVELRRMYVAGNARRQGLARSLLDHAENVARESGQQKVVLSTSILQEAAIALYRAAAYKLVGVESATTANYKSIGSGVLRYHFEKVL